MARMFHGREYGTSMHMFGAGFIWGEDTKVTKRDRYCERCGCHGKSITVNFCGPALREVEFCIECLEIVRKPRQLGKEAFTSMPVTIDAGGEYVGGWTEKYAKAIPIRVYHCDEEMREYHREEANGIVTAIYECPVCLRERLLKFFTAEESNS